MEYGVYSMLSAGEKDVRKVRLSAEKRRVEAGIKIERNWD